jgi:hypothetical protein
VKAFAMILDREYDPSDADLIYHYCPAQAFVEIVNNRSLWLSAYWTMNDETEREWGYGAFEKAAKELHHKVGQEFLERVYEPVKISLLKTVPMIASLSLEGDLLNQWTRYADSGRGFSIGFSAKPMKHLPIRHLRVLYEEDVQVQELLEKLSHIYQYEKSIGFKYDEKFQTHVFNIGNDLCAYKNPAFEQEQEIRFVHMSAMVPVGSSFKIRALGARDQSGKRVHKPLKIHFRVREGVVTPYVILDYSKGGAISPIKEVILGPGNENSELNINLFLNTIGMKDVIVRRSKAALPS